MGKETYGRGLATSLYRTAEQNMLLWEKRQELQRNSFQAEANKAGQEEIKTASDKVQIFVQTLIDETNE